MDVFRPPNTMIHPVAVVTHPLPSDWLRDLDAINCYAAIEVKTMTAIEFLKRAADGKHRIVSSGDLHVMQISEAQANKLFFVDDETGLGWALVPWELTTAKDRNREEEYFTRNLTEVVVAHDDASSHQAIYIDGKLHSQETDPLADFSFHLPNFLQQVPLMLIEVAVNPADHFNRTMAAQHRYSCDIHSA